MVGDAVSALLTLGYKRGEAEKAVQRVQADAAETLTVGSRTLGLRIFFRDLSHAA